MSWRALKRKVNVDDMRKKKETSYNPWEGRKKKTPILSYFLGAGQKLYISNTCHTDHYRPLAGPKGSFLVQTCDLSATINIVSNLLHRCRPQESMRRQAGALSRVRARLGAGPARMARCLRTRLSAALTDRGRACWQEPGVADCAI